MNRFFWAIIVFLATSSLSSAFELFPRKLNQMEIEQKLAKIPEEETSRSKANLLANLGTLYFKEYRYADAVKSFEKALLQPCGRHLRQHIYRTMAKCFEALGQFDKNIEALQNAVIQDPKNWKRHRDLAGAYGRVQLYEKAAQAFDTALNLNSKEARLYFDAGQIYRHLLIYEKAAQYVERARILGKQGPEWDREMSLILEGQGRYKESVAHFRKTMGAVAPVADVARVLYLALMSSDTELARKMLDRLQKMPEAKASIGFYEEVLKSFADSPSQVLEKQFHNPTLKALVLVP